MLKRLFLILLIFQLGLASAAAAYGSSPSPPDTPSKTAADAKGVIECSADVSWGSCLGMAAGFIPVAGDAAKIILKKDDEIVEATFNTTTKKFDDVKKASATNRLPVPDDLPTNIHPGQQGKHIPGHNNFDPNRSPLNSNVNPDDLLSGVHSGQYPIVRTDPRGNPVVDFGADIGSYVQRGQAGVPTRYGTIHYGQNGAHVVPANPNIN